MVSALSAEAYTTTWLVMVIDKNSAAWQYHLAALHTTEVLHRVLTWLDNGD